MTSQKRSILRTAIVGWEIEPRSSIEKNLNRAEALIAAASRRGAQAMGFVEYFSTLGTSIAPRDMAELPGKGPVTRWGVRMASKYHIEIWCPFVELDSKGRKFNAVAVIDPKDAIVGTAQEFHYLALRNQGLHVGSGIRVFQRPWGVLGSFLCFDIHYAEIARVLAMMGAEVVFWPTLTAGPWSIESVRAKASVRCMDNGFWLIESNLAGQPPYAPYATRWEPGSCVFDPEGVMVANTGRRPGICLVDIDPGRRSFGSHCIGLSRRPEANACEDLRDGFLKCLRPEYYARAYQSFRQSNQPQGRSDRVRHRQKTNV